jgi:hypothetical protein
MSKPLADRLFSRTNDANDMSEKQEDEAADEQPNDGIDAGGDPGAGGDENFKEEDERHTNEKDFKPVFLKGLFRSVGFSRCPPNYAMLMLYLGV